MNDIIKKENIENMIYEIRGKQVMLDNEVSATKYHDYIFINIIITYCDIGKIISMLKD